MLSFTHFHWYFGENKLYKLCYCFVILLKSYLVCGCYYMLISTEGWGPPTTRSETGYPVRGLRAGLPHSKGKEMVYLMMHLTHFIYGYMASDIWWRTTQIVREETRCCHMGYSFRLTARVLLCAPSHIPQAFGTPVMEHWLEREVTQ